MPFFTWTYLCLLLPFATFSLLADCDLVMDSANYGKTFHDLDDFLFVAGKQFTKDVLQQKLQEYIERNEKKEHQHCSQYSFPIDTALGVETGYTNGLRHLTARLAATIYANQWKNA